MQAEIDDGQMGYFLERPLSATIDNYQLSDIVDGMIATGFREPNIPLFCMHEYKRSLENQSAPDAQVLVAMLVARELNPQSHAIYGLCVIGFHWHFMVLDGNHYCISKTYNADDEEIFILFKMLKNLKTIISIYLPPAND